MIQKNEFPILEYDFDSTEILKPNHGAEQLTLPEKCVFAFLGDTIDSYAAETVAAVAEHFETITKTYPIYVVKNDGEEFCLCQAPLGAPAAAQFMGLSHCLRVQENCYGRLVRRVDRNGRERISYPDQSAAG